MILDFRKLAIQDVDPIGRDEGMKVACYVRKNRCVFNRNPYVKSEFFIVYGEGTEQVLEVLQVCLDKEILFKAGAWIRDIDQSTGEPRILQDGTVLKFQGKAAFKEFCLAHPEYLDELKHRCGGGHYESLSEEEIAILEAEEKDSQEAFTALTSLQEAIADEEKPKKGKKK